MHLHFEIAVPFGLLVQYLFLLESSINEKLYARFRIHSAVLKKRAAEEIIEDWFYFCK